MPMRRLGPSTALAVWFGSSLLYCNASDVLPSAPSTPLAGASGASGGTKSDEELVGGSAVGHTAGAPGEAAGAPLASGGMAGSVGVGGGTGGAGAGAPEPVAQQPVKASCTDGKHPVCLDFEGGQVPPGWQTPMTHELQVERGHAAHGEYAMHVSNLHSKPSALITTGELNGIKDVMWGRYYHYVSPAAAWGHGAMVWVGDAGSPTNFYEVGFESNAYLGMWIQGDHWLEKYMRSTVTVPGNKWVCVEFLFDGAAPSVGRYWVDGSEIIFDSKRVAGTDPIQNYRGPAAVLKAEQFTIFKIGIEFYHGSSTVSCPDYPPFLCPTYNNDDAPSMTDIWIDDVALDTTRVGCL